ncbi:MAG: DUF2752 domain-containing protein [Bacteroidetes bacterium]|nr:DUF2752 domain-containing protein [Bacteroidota bacterium]
MTRRRLYPIIAIVCSLAYAWLFLFNHAHDEENSHVQTVCIVKNVTGVPCPSCGSTRSIFMLMQGDFLGAAKANPIGLISALVLIVAPLWLFFDLIKRRETLLEFYLTFEQFIRKKQHAIPAITLVIANWIWNIYKGY